jgi:ferredoxin-thioredoxin reductase catalytic subunit
VTIKIKSARALGEVIKNNAREKGYFLNNVDTERVDFLIDGLFKNLDRYGYISCPCRLSSGKYAGDEDLICPCEYMEEDVKEFGACFCGLYVSKEVSEGKKEFVPVRERRSPKKTFAVISQNGDKKIDAVVWRCPICGYRAAGEKVTEKCRKCGAAASVFEKM